MKQERIEPTANQQKYLGYLLSRAHEIGMPHLNTDGFSRKQTSEWIDFLAGTVVKDIQREQTSEEGKKKGASRSSSSFLPILAGTYGYRSALSETTSRKNAKLSESNHLHEIEPWQTEDGWEILECATCGEQW